MADQPETAKRPCPICDAWSCSCAKETAGVRCGDCGGSWHGGDTECQTRPSPRRDWMLVYVRDGDPAYWVAADGELLVPSDVPPREEWAPENAGLSAMSGDPNMAECIAALKARMDAAEVAARAARREYEAALCGAHQFREGDVIRSSDGNLAKVVGVYAKFGMPRVKAVLQKKDGTWGIKEASMWRTEWERATLHERAS